MDMIHLGALALELFWWIVGAKSKTELSRPFCVECCMDDTNAMRQMICYIQHLE
jgi:hypothetical protein